jgi:putative ABC transport system permease protein
MPLSEAARLALQAVWAHKLRSFFTVLGIVVSVAFLIAVVAVIQGMNAYVEENLAGALIGTNSFQVRRSPISVAQFDDEEWREIQRRPVVDRRDAEYVQRALPDAYAISVQSGWPPPRSDVRWGNRTIGDAQIYGVTSPYHVVQDHRFEAGEPLSEIDIRERRYVAVLGWEVADKLFEDPQLAVGKRIRAAGLPLEVKGVVQKKGSVLGLSFDGFVMVPISTFEMVYGRRRTTVISVKVSNAAILPDAMARAEEAMRMARRLRPGEENDFVIDKADALVSFWTALTQVLFTILPAVVGIGVVVGGIVIMNIMLMSVNERTREIGIRKSLGARSRDIQRQFLAEAITLAALGGLLGVTAGFLFAQVIALVSPLPARVTTWSVAVALLLGAGVGVVFGVYPARRAARLNPVEALRYE